MIGIIIFVFIVALFCWIIFYAAKHRKTPPEDSSEKDRYYLKEMESIKLQAQESLHEQELEHRESIRAVRKDSVQRSRFSLTGKIYEQICSMFKGFPYNPADMRFLGSPCDYIVFQGMSKKDIGKVIFLEIKTGDSKLTEQQEKLKRAVKAKRVEWREYRLKPKGLNTRRY